MIRKVVLIGAAIASVACSRTKVQTAGGDVVGAVPPNARSLSVGTTIEVKTNARLGAGENRLAMRSRRP